jgi:hypothetical protein
MTIGVHRKSMRGGGAVILTFDGAGSKVQPCSGVGTGLGGGSVVSSCSASSPEASGWLVEVRQWWGATAWVSAMKSPNSIDGLNYIYGPRHWIIGDTEFYSILSLIWFKIDSVGKIQKGEIFFGYGIYLALTLLVSWARKQGSTGLGPRDRCSLLALHGVDVDTRRRWTTVVGSRQAATADDRHGHVL